MLADLVVRVVAVLANAQDRVDGNAIATDGDGFLDRVEDRNAVFLAGRPADIALRQLIDIKRRQLERRAWSSILFPAFEDLPQNHVGV